MKWKIEDTLRTLQARWKALGKQIVNWMDQTYNMRRSSQKTSKKYDEIKTAVNTKVWSVSDREL